MKQKNNDQQLIQQKKELLRKYETLTEEYNHHLELMVNTKFHLQEINKQKSRLTHQLLMIRKSLLEKG